MEKVVTTSLLTNYFVSESFIALLMGLMKDKHYIKIKFCE